VAGKTGTERVEDLARLGIMAAIGVMAGAASFTHMHDWTMQALPAGTADWFGWANAVASELMPTCALLEIRRRHRVGASIRYPVALLVASGVLSLGAQVSQAGDSLTSKGLAALPAVAFMLLAKLVFSSLPQHTDPSTDEPESAAAQQNDDEATSTFRPTGPAPSVPSVPRPVVPVVPSAPVVPNRANGAPVVIGR